MIKLLGLILLIGAACAEVPRTSRPKPQDFRLRYLSLEEIQAVTSSGEADVRFDGQDIRMRVAVSGGETVRTVVAKVLGENRSGDWYATLVREKEIKTILPWFEKGSAQSLAEIVVPGDLIVLHRVSE